LTRVLSKAGSPTATALKVQSVGWQSSVDSACVNSRPVGTQSESDPSSESESRSIDCLIDQ